MTKLRMGVIGLGNMGSAHSAYLFDNVVDRASLGVICDLDPEKLKKFSARYPGVPAFATHKELLASGTCDAILIAVPHYDHVPIAMDAFAKGVHVLCEKPLAVSVKAAREISELHAKKYGHLKFGVMFNQRTNPLYQKMRDLVATGEIGEVSRITWICTAWFRSWTYYASGGWRATWKGEGGGVLINQCPHSLDLFQWIPNMMPNRVTAVSFIGKTHPIEVEDEVSAILEYPNGAVGHFIASTGEAPGANRLEIAGSMGKLVAEDGKLKFWRNRVDAQEYNRTTPKIFGSPESWPIDLPVKASDGGVSEHQAMTRIFVNAVLDNTANDKLLAPGPDGMRGLEIGNAILMAGVTRTPVTLPMDGDAYDAFIDEMAKKYAGRKTLETKTATVATLVGSV
jgi:predicted dehydrogenase